MDLQRLLIERMENRILVGLTVVLASMVLVGWIAINETGRMASFQQQHLARSIEKGAELFANNCAFCHGTSGKGDGPVLQVMRDKYNYPQSNPGGQYTITPDLTSDVVNAQPDVAIYAWITNGVTVMPPFNKLLTVEERWLAVNYIRTLPQ